jgi:hypothetical protein
MVTEYLVSWSSTREHGMHEETLIHATARYLPIALTIGLEARFRPDRRRMAGARPATPWNLAALLALNVIARRVGWWCYGNAGAVAAGIPTDPWIGRALTVTDVVAVDPPSTDRTGAHDGTGVEPWPAL